MVSVFALTFPREINVAPQTRRARRESRAVCTTSDSSCRVLDADSLRARRPRGGAPSMKNANTNNYVTLGAYRSTQTTT